jgi:hypothetical protein
MAAPTTWIYQTHHVFGTKTLTAEDPRAPRPEGFLGELWAPQATLLAHMLALEDRPVVRVGVPEDHADTLGESGPLLQFRSGRIAAEFSFGKTVLCVALACASPCPRAFPTPLNFLTMEAGSNKNRLAVSKYGSSRNYVFKEQGRGVMPTMTLRYQRLIRATLVVAAPSVISQWEDCIRTFAPHLSFFTIENVKTLRQFHALFQTPEMDGINLVFLKAGKVTTTFTVEGEPKIETRQRALTKALYMATEGRVWGRMIVDDFDTIRLASEDLFLPALFTWVISATCRSTMIRQSITAAPTVEEFVRQNCTLPILGAACDDLFDNVLKLHCDEQYVHDHINTTTVAYRRLVVEGGNAVGILQDLGVPDDIVEMAAAGAVETAAERLDIKVANVGELIERVLAARTEKYRKAVRTLDRVARAREAATQSALPRNGNGSMKAIRKSLKDDDDEAALERTLALIGRPGPLFTNAMRTLEEWALKERDEHGGRLQRMRENVRQGQCQGCMVPIDEDGESYIVNCCQIVICGYCTIVGDRGRRHYINRCPNCAAAVDPKRHLIYVGADLELESALTDEALMQGAEAEPEPEPAAPEPEAKEAPAEEEEENGDGRNYAAWDGEPRLRALLQLINGDAIQAVSNGPVPAIVQGLLEGRRAVPVPGDVPHKYLIFAMHAESARQIAAGLEAMGINYALLRGTRQKKDEAVRRFKSREDYADAHGGSVDILIATSSRDCAGLHLPEVTRLVLYHHHVDKHIAEQAVGRAQRVGREYSLEVIEILNEGEAERFG